MTDKISKKALFADYDPHDIAALGFCLAGFVIGVFLVIYKYRHFGYTDWDFAIYAQAMWSMVHGSLHTSLMGMNFLGNHAQYISFLIAPIYFLFQHPLTLVFLKLFSFFFGCYLFYRISKEKLGGPQALIWLSFYLFFPANMFMLQKEFHFESLAIGPFFLLYAFFRQKKFRPFMAAAFLICMIKENLPFVIVAFGIYALFSRRDRKFVWAGSALGLGLLFIVIGLFLVTPFIRRGLPITQNIYLSHYVGTVEGAAAPFAWLGPFAQKFMNIWSSEPNIAYLRALFSPLCWLPLLSPHVLFLGSPLILQNLLYPSGEQKILFFHYTATLLPFIFLAGMNSFSWLSTRFHFDGRKGRILLYCVIGTWLAGSYQSLPYLKNEFFNWKDRLDPVRRQMVRMVPKQAGVVSTFNLLGALSQRKDLYALYNVWKNINFFTGEHPYRLPDGVPYALIDFDDPWMRSAAFHNREVTLRLAHFFMVQPWTAKAAVENIVLFERGKTMGAPLLEKAFTPFEGREKTAPFLIELDDIALRSIRTHDVDLQSRILPFTFFWESRENASSFFEVSIEFLKDDQPVLAVFHPVGYLMYPSRLWQKGEYIKERYNVSTATLMPGRYGVRLHLRRFTYTYQQDPATLSIWTRSAVDTVATVDLKDIVIP